MGMIDSLTGLHVRVYVTLQFQGNLHAVRTHDSDMRAVIISYLTVLSLPRLCENTEMLRAPHEPISFLVHLLPSTGNSLVFGHRDFNCGKMSSSPQ